MKRRGIVDLETGVVVELRPGIRRSLSLAKLYGSGWYGANAAEMGLVLMDPDLNWSEHRVLGACLLKLGYNNVIEARQADISRFTGMQRPHVHRSLKRLLEEGILVESKELGLRLHPRLGFKGDATGRVDEKTREFVDGAGRSARETGDLDNDPRRG